MKRPPHKPGKRRQHSELVWLGPYAGFTAGQCYGWIHPEPEYILKQPSPYYRPDAILPVYLADTQGCVLLCPDRKCQEWNDVRLVAGATRQEALANIIAQNFLGWAFHVSECQMFDDKPPPARKPRQSRRNADPKPPPAAAAPAGIAAPPAFHTANRNASGSP